MNNQKDEQMTWALFIMGLLFLATMMLGCAKSSNTPAPVATPPPCITNGDALRSQLATLTAQAAVDQTTIADNTAWIAAHPGSPGIKGHQTNIDTATADLQLTNEAINATNEQLLTPDCK